MLTDLLLLLGGLAVIIKGGDLFVSASVRLAGLYRLPRVVVGSTLVSLATTTPELVVSVIAGLRGESGLAIGNAVGSVVCNLTLILGITAALKAVEVHPSALRPPLGALFLAMGLLIAFTWDRQLARWQGAILLALGAAYFVWDFVRHWRDRRPADLSEASAIGSGIVGTRFPWLQTPSGSLTQFVFGAGIVVLGSRLVVDGAIGVAGRLGVPSLVVGLTVVAVGTSLPELVTAITSSRRSVSDLAVGNVLGANIANLTLIIGLAALIRPVEIDRLAQRFSFPAALAILVLLTGLLFRHRGLPRPAGRMLLVIYGVYLATVCLLELRSRTVH